jgi:hypothetical protein
MEQIFFKLKEKSINHFGTKRIVEVILWNKRNKYFLNKTNKVLFISEQKKSGPHFLEQLKQTFLK